MAAPSSTPCGSVKSCPPAFGTAAGLEMAIQPLHPESQPTGWNLQSFWIARRMADLYGYTNMPITSCFEFDYRSTGPGGLSWKRQADWYARDVLHCLAWRCPNINVALIADVNASYYTSRWGATGVFRRSPLHMPKPAFVSLATLTLLLDRAEYQRAVPTGFHRSVLPGIQARHKVRLCHLGGTRDAAGRTQSGGRQAGNRRGQHGPRSETGRQGRKTGADGNRIALLRGAIQAGGRRHARGAGA